MQPDALKVLIYATWRDRLPVFDQPDFPEVDLQVPGGTVEAGENVDEAARREFHEETGLAPPLPLIPLSVHDYHFLKHGRDICHQRHYFHFALAGDYASNWLHQELTPFGGGEPILFRFFWTSIPEARTRLGYGMGHCLPLIG